MMHHLNKTAGRILDTLIQGIEEGGHRKIDNAKSKSIMPVDVEMIESTPNGNIFSVTHFYKQNGDMMHDPDMTFWRTVSGDYYPLSYQQDNLGIYQNVIAERDSDGRIKRYYPGLSAELAAFANSWMRNIKEQQGL